MMLLGDIHRGVQSTIQHLKKGDQQFARKLGYSKSGQDDIAKQVEFLQKISPTLARHYPTLYDHNLDASPPYYTMGYIPFKTVRQLILDSDYDATFIGERLATVLKFLFEIHHPAKAISCSADYLNETYWHRAKKRLKQLAETNTQFQRVLACETLMLDNETLLAPMQYIDKYQNDSKLNTLLMPSQLVFVHGQLEFAHIMVDEHDLDTFKLLDPRGWDALLDDCYDIGKLLICTGYHHDWIETQKFEIAHWRTHDKTLVIDGLQFKMKNRVQVCQQVHTVLTQSLTNWIPPDSNPDIWQLRQQLATAIHLLASTPFCYGIDANIEKALVCYVQGAKAMTAFHNMVQTIL